MNGTSHSFPQSAQVALCDSLLYNRYFNSSYSYEQKSACSLALLSNNVLNLCMPQRSFRSKFSKRVWLKPKLQLKIPVGSHKAQVSLASISKRVSKKGNRRCASAFAVILHSSNRRKVSSKPTREDCINRILPSSSK